MSVQGPPEKTLGAAYEFPRVVVQLAMAGRDLGSGPAPPGVKGGVGGVGERPSHGAPSNMSRWKENPENQPAFPQGRMDWLLRGWDRFGHER